MDKTQSRLTDWVLLMGVLIALAALLSLAMPEKKQPRPYAKYEPLTVRYCTAVRNMLVAGLEFEALDIPTNEQVRMIAEDSNPDSALAYIHNVCLEYYNSRLQTAGE